MHSLTEIPGGQYIIDGDQAVIVVKSLVQAQSAVREVCGKSYTCVQEYVGTVVYVRRYRR